MLVHDGDSYIGQRVYGTVCVWTAACSTSLFDSCDAYICISVYLYIYIYLCVSAEPLQQGDSYIGQRVCSSVYVCVVQHTQPLHHR